MLFVCLRKTSNNYLKERSKLHWCPRCNYSAVREYGQVVHAIQCDGRDLRTFEEIVGDLWYNKNMAMSNYDGQISQVTYIFTQHHFGKIYLYLMINFILYNA